MSVGGIWLKRAGVVGVVAALFMLPSGASADKRKNVDKDISTDSGQEGSQLHAGVRIEFSSDGEGNSGALVSSTRWAPPACYYAPLYTPSELRSREDAWKDYMGGSLHEEEVKEGTRDRYEELFGDEGEFPDFLRGREDEGLFWGRVINQEHPDRAAQRACEWRLYWVEFGETPPAEAGVVDTVTLAELAWEYTRVLETEVTLNPVDAQKVNLPTWIWLDQDAYTDVTVRAGLPDYGIWAETTATPARLRIDPGSSEAVTFPASGTCGASGGRIGEPYARGKAGRTPPCGVTYRRSTGGGSLTMEATLVWEVSWRDFQGNTGDLPAGEFSTPVDIVVEEVQTIVR